METIVALYDDRNSAYEAVNALIEANISREHISLLSADAEGEFQDELADEVQEDYVAEGAARGAVGGGILGGIIGTAIGLSSFAIPGIGPFIGAGALAAALSGMGIGAASGTLYGALVTWGATEMDAHYYAEGLRRGGTLVAVKVPEGSVDYVSEILDNFGAVDIEERAANWRETGWTPQEIGYPESEQVVRDEEDALYEARTSYRNNDAFRYDDYHEDFERHYNDMYSTTGQPYISYEPAYQYGYDVARDIRFRDREWDEIEGTVRDEWGTRIDTGSRPWDEVKEAVNYAWAKVKNTVSDMTDDDDYESVTVDDSDDDYEPWYREHYDTHYMTTGLPYEHYHVYYLYGTRLAEDDMYEDDDWDLVENRVREDWTRDYGDGDSTWEDIKDAVRRGWEAVTDWADGDDYDNDYDSLYREHYNTHYTDRGYPYDYYTPYYQYGTRLAQSDMYDEDDWDLVENRVQEDWTREYGDGDSVWEDIKDAVRRGWEAVTDWDDDDYDAYDDTYYEQYDPAFNEHYSTYYGDMTRPYSYYQPAYRYGIDIGRSPEFANRDWDYIEPSVRTNWERQYTSQDRSWDEVRDAIRYGWTQIRTVP